MSLRSGRAIAAEFQQDDTEWATRAEYWLGHKPVIRGRPKKFNYRKPLVLCGHGVNIRVDHNTLLVRNGFTHYPQKSEQFRFFPGDANLPDRIIILDGSGGITFDALNWMTDQRIEFVRLDWKGQITNIGGNSGYSGNPKLIAAQRAIKGTKAEIQIARNLIAEKLDRCILTLGTVFPKSENRDNSISRIEIQRDKFRNSKKSISMSQLLGMEGQSAVAYFRPWQNLPVKWKGIGRKPIPENWIEIIPRTMVWRKRARAARHPVNAMLNYGYGILAHHLKSRVIAAGLDPTIGIIHGNSQNPIPLVYDLMEPLRPTVDQAVLEFALSHTFTPWDFTITKWGGCRLNPQMAKVVTARIGDIKTNNVPAFISQLRGARRYPGLGVKCRD
jgi:CRISP-associated protein Cas1